MLFLKKKPLFKAVIRSTVDNITVRNVKVAPPLWSILVPFSTLFWFLEPLTFQFWLTPTAFINVMSKLPVQSQTADRVSD